jgi:hypothetical protein
MFHPVSLVPVHGVIVAYCLDCVLSIVVSGVVKFFSLSPSCLKNKNFTSTSLIVITKRDHYIWYQSGVQPKTWDHYNFHCYDFIIMMIIELTCIRAGNHG